MKLFSMLPRSIRFFAIVIITASLIIGAGLGLESRLVSSNLAPQPVASPIGSPKPPAVLPMQVSPTPRPVPSLPAASPVVVSPASVPVAPIQPVAQPNVNAVALTVQSSYGHFSYQEDEAARLQIVGQFVRDNYARDEALDLEAVQAFQQMAIAAKATGVALMPLSGFRTIADQAALFARQVERQGSKEAAARWSAPPGYSEHHTGYALDIADRQRPDTDLQMSFQATSAYQWLGANASQYGFELSFPPNNLQGISFEPWHWRYVGSTRAMQVFAAAKRLP